MVYTTIDHAIQVVKRKCGKHLNSTVGPLQELKGFRRIFVQPGKTQAVTLKPAARDLAYWSIDEQRFVVEHDTIQIRIGQSSAGIQLETMLNVVATGQ